MEWGQNHAVPKWPLTRIRYTAIDEFAESVSRGFGFLANFTFNLQSTETSARGRLQIRKTTGGRPVYSVFVHLALDLIQDLFASRSLHRQILF